MAPCCTWAWDHIRVGRRVYVVRDVPGPLGQASAVHIDWLDRRIDVDDRLLPRERVLAILAAADFIRAAVMVPVLRERVG